MGERILDVQSKISNRTQVVLTQRYCASIFLFMKKIEKKKKENLFFFFIWCEKVLLLCFSGHIRLFFCPPNVNLMFGQDKFVVPVKIISN